MANVASNTKNPLHEALSGTIPVVLFILTNLMVFSSSQWCFDNPAFVILMFFPSYSMCSSKQIVCNFTHMKMDPLPKSFFWFLLFPLNRLISIALLEKDISYQNLVTETNLFIKEDYVALAIFVINLTWYMTFVVCTIGQITELLDINCLSIKKKPDLKTK